MASLYLREGCCEGAFSGSKGSGAFSVIFLSFFSLNFLKALWVFFQGRVCWRDGYFLGVQKE